MPDLHAGCIPEEFLPGQPRLYCIVMFWGIGSARPAVPDPTSFMAHNVCCSFGKGCMSIGSAGRLLPKFQFGRSPWPLTKSPNIERVASLTDFSDIRRPMCKVRSKKASRPEGGLTCPRDRLSRLSLTLWCSRRFFEGSNQK